MTISALRRLTETLRRADIEETLTELGPACLGGSVQGVPVELSDETGFTEIPGSSLDDDLLKSR